MYLQTLQRNFISRDYGFNVFSVKRRFSRFQF
jgi:hypothetical protein